MGILDFLALNIKGADVKFLIDDLGQFILTDSDGDKIIVDL